MLLTDMVPAFISQVYLMTKPILDRSKHRTKLIQKVYQGSLS
jgi:hypothetical protein